MAPVSKLSLIHACIRLLFYPINVNNVLHIIERLTTYGAVPQCA